MNESTVLFLYIIFFTIAMASPVILLSQSQSEYVGEYRVVRDSMCASIEDVIVIDEKVCVYRSRVNGRFEYRSC